MNARSYSDINTYQRCPRKYMYRELWGVEKKKQDTNLFIGIRAHDIFKWLFLAIQAGNPDPWGAMLVELEASFAGAKETMFEDELVDARAEVDKILDIIARFYEQFNEEWEILHVEEQFISLLDSGDVISFTPDLVVRDKNGSVWIVDWKTTSRMPGDDGLPFGDTQSLLYYSGVKALYPECAGFIFSRIRKKIPTQPRLAKTGKTRVADLQRIDTTYEILRDFLQDTAPGLLSDPAHQRRLAQLRDEPGRFFWTDTVYVNDAMTEAILTDVKAVLTQIKQSEKNNEWPRHLLESNGYKDCRRCPYLSLCRGELLGLDVEPILEAEYQERTEKNPYEEEIDD